jgi:unsaturated rhamnogalacturonyl hydrolase
MKTGPFRHFPRQARLILVAAIFILGAGASPLRAGNTSGGSWPQDVANAAMQRWPPGQATASAGRGQIDDQRAMLLDGMDAMWYATADARYFTYVQQSIDQLIRADGSFTDPSAHSLHDPLLGRQLLLLYGVTEDKRYYKAATLLRHQHDAPPTAASLKPAQPRREGMYAAPFFAQYASMFHEPQDLAEITTQLTLAAQREGTDSSARDLGRYMMALADALPYYPDDNPGRRQLLDALQRATTAVVRYQETESGLWRQVLAPRGEKDQHFDLAASGMFTYALAKSVRYGYLPASYAHNAQLAWNAIQSQHQLAASNDAIEVGAFLLAATEMAYAPEAPRHAEGTILLDAWYNSQTRRNAAEQTGLFHYKWNDYSNSGFSLLGHIFRASGLETKTLLTAPSLDTLKGARIYIIVSPDIPAKNPNPHYMDRQAAEQIASWVKQGGTLLLMENDPANADIQHMDILADRFGLHFNDVLTHHVIGDQHDMGRIDTAGNAAPFTQPHHLFMKDTCSLALSAGAVPLLRWQGDTLMAMAHYGKGTVVAVADPWLYNEYADGRNLPPSYDNFAAGQEFVHWLIEQH